MCTSKLVTMNPSQDSSIGSTSAAWYWGGPGLKSWVQIMMQETEIEKDFNYELLNIPGYSFECETNDVKRRVGTYIKNTIKYKRCYELEGENKNHEEM